MFAPVELARRIEEAEARLGIDIATAVAARRPHASVFHRRLGGGAAIYGGACSPINKLVGAGFDGPLDLPALTAIEEAFEARGERLQAEVATLADPRVHAQLTARGYQLAGFENVLGRALGDVQPRDTWPIEPVADVDLATWATMLVDGFERPDAQGMPGDQLPPRDVVEQVVGDMVAVANLYRYVVRSAGTMIAGASLRLDAGIAQLTGSATLEPYRRRGLQSALIAHRLGHAARAGAEVAVVTTAPGSKSQQNLQKQGFCLLYSRALLVREPTSPRPAAGPDRS